MPLQINRLFIRLLAYFNYALNQCFLFGQDERSQVLTTTGLVIAVKRFPP